ncbi:hypothetical protein TrRE_jg4718 [Triparma retinervis]|uniref:STAS domain-containing protein n=1 Tax=Triparma retinervis TaxID=2557542 RepID=A0A9W6Z902_9STRA|nr:hypothetical protein TrRE_jg4718 [Triparma retinervis]
MPRAIMASIIFAALKNMITFQTARRLFRVSKVDFTLWCIAFVFTSLLGVTWGIVISIVMSMLLLIKYQAKPAAKILGVLKGSDDLCVDIKQFADAHEIEGVKIFEFTAPLHFANKDHFEARLKKMEVRSQWRNLHVVIIDCACVTYIDITCIKMLERLQARYTAKNVELIFSNWRGRDMREILDASGLYDTIGANKFFLDMRSALNYARKFAEKAKIKAEAALTDSPMLGAVSSDGMEIVPLTINESAV